MVLHCTHSKFNRRKLGFIDKPRATDDILKFLLEETAEPDVASSASPEDPESDETGGSGFHLLFIDIDERGQAN